MPKLATTVFPLVPHPDLIQVRLGDCILVYRATLPLGSLLRRPILVEIAHSRTPFQHSKTTTTTTPKIKDPKERLRQGSTRAPIKIHCPTLLIGPSLPLRMAPLPPPIPEKPRPPPTLPALHLRVHNLTSTGSSRFFSHTSSPGYILASSSHKVLAQLYPPSLPSILQSSSPPVRSITLFLRPFDGVAHTNGSELDNEHKEVHLSTEYLEKIGGDSKRIRDEIEGVVVHELVHVYQYNGNGTAPGKWRGVGGLVES